MPSRHMLRVPPAFLLGMEQPCYAKEEYANQNDQSERPEHHQQTPNRGIGQMTRLSCLPTCYPLA